MTFFCLQEIRGKYEKVCGNLKNYGENMKEYEEIYGKYEEICGNLKNYVENMKEYEESCGKYEEIYETYYVENLWGFFPLYTACGTWKNSELCPSR